MLAYVGDTHFPDHTVGGCCGEGGEELHDQVDLSQLELSSELRHGAAGTASPEHHAWPSSQEDEVHQEADDEDTVHPRLQ